MNLFHANQSGQWHIQQVAETGSTNADLLAAGAAGAPDRTVLRADYQSAGRGRLDRTWEAPPKGNLLVSLLFRHIPDRVHVLTQVVALSALTAAKELCDVEAHLKWPNDIVVEGKKLAGILAQAAPVDERGVIPFVVVGIGVNLAWAPDDAVSLASCGWRRAVEPQEFLEYMLPDIDRLLSLADSDLHEEYKNKVATIGMRVRAEMPSGEHIVGRALDVEPDGRIVVLDECAVTHRIDTADVVHLRPVVD